MGQLFDVILFAPIVNALVLILGGLISLSVPGALGFAIIILTVLIRLAVWPLVEAQLKSAKKIAELRPHLEHLKAKHKEDKQALQLATLELYKEHGVNPAGGCLPLIIQAVVLYVFYQVINYLFSGDSGLDRINSLLYSQSWHLQTPPDPHFFGVNLASHPTDFSNTGIFILIIPLLTAAITFVQSKMMIINPSKKEAEIKNEDLRSLPKAGKKKKEKISTEDTMAAMQTQMMYIMPLMIGYFSFTLPVGISLYWITLTLMSVIQQYIIYGWGGLADLLPFLKRSSSPLSLK